LALNAALMVKLSNLHLTANTPTAVVCIVVSIDNKNFV